MMTSRVWSAVVAFALGAGALPAAADDITGTAEVGAGYLSNDAYRFGSRFGVNEQGLEPVLNLNLASSPAVDDDGTGYWRASGQGLGLDSHRVNLEAGEQGRQRLRLDYRQIRSYQSDDAVTPLRGAGSSVLTLPLNWQATGNTTAGMTQLDESLVDVDLWRKRRSLALDYRRALDSHWTLHADARRERVEGTRALSGATGSTGGNVRALLMPAPVDYETDLLTLGLTYTGKRYQWGVAYHGSFFENGASQLIWPTAFGQHPQWAPGVGYPAGSNQQALEPDNQAHELRAHGNIVLGRTTRLHADVAFGRHLQDERFLPYTINSALAVTEALPRNSLDAEVDTTRVNLRLTARPLRRLNLVARLGYRDRDNNTPRDAYQRVRSDAGPQQAFIDARLNRPYSLTQTDFSTEASYRLARAVTATAGYQYQEIERDYQEVSETEEHGFSAGLRSTAWENVALAINYRFLTRDASRYVGNRPLIDTHVPGSVQAQDFENHPLLRKYYLTERDRHQWQLRGDWFATQSLSLGAALTHNEDDYDAVLGLDEAQVTSFTLDAVYAANDTFNVGAFYTVERYTSEQAGRSFRGSVPADAFDPNRNWYLDTRDRFDTAGLNINLEQLQQHWQALPGRLDLGLELLYSRSQGRLDNSVGTALGHAPLPDLYTRLDSVRVEARYHLSKRSLIRLAVEHERYRSEDFAFDGVAVDSIANVLLLGEQSPSYNTTWTTLAYRFEF